MKKILLILAILCSFCSMNAQNVGDEFEIPTYGKFRISSIEPNEVTLLKVLDVYSVGADFNTVTYNDKNYYITAVAANAFKEYHNENSNFSFKYIRTMGERAFGEAVFHNVYLQESTLTEIPSNCFRESSFKGIYFPKTLTKICENAFQWSNISTINAQNLTHIEGAAFYSCPELESIYLDKIVYIGGSAFYDCTKLKNISLPECLETVEENAFERCYLSSFTMYNTAKTFKNSPKMMSDEGVVNMHIVDWSNKNVLTNTTSFSQNINYDYNNVAVSGDYTLPNNLETLGEGALFHNIDITIINLPSTLTQIGAKAFAKCSNLCAIHCDAPTAPVVANANAFDEVYKNINIFIPDNADSYYSYTHATGWKDFSNYLVSLQTVKDAAIKELNHTAGNNPSQAVQNIVADYSSQINEANDRPTVETLLQEGIEAIKAQIYIDRGVVKINNIYYILNKEKHTATVTYGGLEIDDYVTAEYQGNITIPATVEYENATYNVSFIGEHAFQNCTELTAITFPEDIQEIEFYAFYNCSKIKNLVLPLYTTDIYDYAFASCTALKTLELPYMIHFIGDKAFNNCSALTAMTSLSPTPSILADGPFDGVDKSIPVTIQSNSLTLYQEGPWGIFSNFVTNTSLDEAKTNAKNAIVAALGSYSFVNYIGSLAMNFCQHIDASTTVDAVNSLRTEGVYAVTYSIKTYQATFGEMGEECHDCPSVEVIKGGNKVILYNPEKVEFIKQ